MQEWRFTLKSQFSLLVHICHFSFYIIMGLVIYYNLFYFYIFAVVFKEQKKWEFVFFFF